MSRFSTRLDDPDPTETSMTDKQNDGSSREGFGDDQGTRVGSPDPGRPRAAEKGARVDAGTDAPTGAGAEAAEGIHGAQGRPDSARTGVSAPRGTDESPATSETSGSEPLRDREVTHQSGYGGEMGEAKKSSDQR
jgi:hypothetical protein